MSIERLGEDAARLEAALRDRLRPDDPGLRDLLARRPEWGEILVQAASAEFAPKVLAELCADERPEDRRWVEELLAEARAAERVSAGPRASRRPTWILAAAAALVFAAGVALWSSKSGPVTDDSQDLGGSGQDGTHVEPGVTCLAPDPDAAAYETFDWETSAALEAGQAYLVVVTTCAGAGQPAVELARESIRPSPLVTGAAQTRWSPSPQERAQWPDCVVWSVRLIGAADEELSSDSARVERSPR